MGENLLNEDVLTVLKRVGGKVEYIESTLAKTLVAESFHTIKSNLDILAIMVQRLSDNNQEKGEAQNLKDEAQTATNKLGESLEKIMEEWIALKAMSIDHI